MSRYSERFEVGAGFDSSGERATRPLQANTMWLEFLNGPQRGHRIPVTQDLPLRVGRDSSCDLPLEDRKASRFHCRVRWQAGGWYIEDAESANGTFVNGERITRRRLAEGDTLRVGDTALGVVLGHAPDRAFPRVGRGPRHRPRHSRARGSSGLPSAGLISLLAGVFAILVVVLIALSGGQERPARRDRSRLTEAPGGVPSPSGSTSGTEAAEEPLAGSTPPSGPRAPQDHPGPATPRDSQAEALSASRAEGETPLAVAAVPSVSSRDGSRGATREEISRGTTVVDSRSTEGEVDSQVWMALARLDFDAARYGGNGLSDGDVSNADLAWKSLVRAAEAEVRRSSVFSIAWESEEWLPLLDNQGRLVVQGALDSRGEYRCLRLDEGVVTLTSGAEEWSLDLLALPNATLLDLLRRQAAPRETERRALEGLGVLLCAVRGPERARRWITALDLPGERRAELREVLTLAPGVWLRAQSQALGYRLARLKRAAVNDAAPWTRLALRSAGLLLFGRDLPETRTVVPQVRQVFREARLAALRLRPPPFLFRSSSMEWEDGHVRLLYDFRSERQLEDFVTVGDDSRLRRRGESLELRGECRLLGGSPFQRRLIVKIRVPAGAYDPSAPNVNVALWSADGHGVTPRSGLSLTKAMLDEPSFPTAYVVFGLGYRTNSTDFGGEALEQVRPAGEREFVQLPAFVLFAGAPRKPLHSEPGECLEARPLGRSLRGSLQVEIELSEESCRWSLNGRSLLPEPERLSARLAASGMWVGSLSLFTNGRVVRLTSLEVTGELHPQWLESALEERTRSELVALERSR